MDAAQPLAAIVLVAALLGGALLALKKRAAASISGTGRRRLEVVERISLGPHHSLHLVRAGGRLLLVATAPNSCQLLDHSVSGEDEA
jgi:flagellar biogenesis protein FliO